METLNRPLRYGLVGAAAGLVGWWLSKSLGTDPNTAEPPIPALAMHARLPTARAAG